MEDCWFREVRFDSFQHCTVGEIWRYSTGVRDYLFDELEMHRQEAEDLLCEGGGLRQAGDQQGTLQRFEGIFKTGGFGGAW